MSDEGTRWTLIEDQGTTIFCLGVFKNAETALGRAMKEIFEYKEEYSGDNRRFDMSNLYELDGDSGWGIRITFGIEGMEDIQHVYYILETGGEDE